MYKGVHLLKRADGMSKQEFREWLVGERFSVPPSYGKIRKYTASFYVAQGPKSPWEDRDEPPFDAASEFWCDDQETVDELHRQFLAAGGVDNSLRNCRIRHAMVAEEVDMLRRDWQ